MTKDLEKIIGKFLTIENENLKITTIDNGLINYTFLVEVADAQYILQQINTATFKNPNAVQNNLLKAIIALKKQNYSLNSTSYLPTLNGDSLYFQTPEKPWRMFYFIENTQTFIKVKSPKMAFEASKTLSHFYKTINAEVFDLEEVLPGFINFEKRIDDYFISLKTNDLERKNRAEKAIGFVNEHLNLPPKFIDLQKLNLLPKRIIHADPKISNILFDDAENGVAVIDLDTIMHGTLLYDFGDMVRSYTNTLDEDDCSTENNFDATLYSAVKEGFLSHLKTDLEDIEIENLDYAAKVVIYIQAVRFLTDFLNGDKYYHVKYENQNLCRAENQINLLKGILAHVKE